jgi:large repetitive protein
MGQTTEYGYYPNGLLKSVKDAKGQITQYIYDAANRLTEITYADATKDTFQYDAAGNLTSYAKPGVSGTITYGELNRKTEEAVNIGGFSKTYKYSYDAAGNKQSYTSPEGKVYSYGYNKNNQVTGITTDGKIISLDYQWIRQTKTTLPNNVTTDFGYNANSWLAALETKQNASPLSSTGYSFDKVGNITAKTGDNAISYGYDRTYQLTNSTNSQNSETFTYDKVGNRSDSTVNANNELLSNAAATYTYDANGNTTTKTVNGQTTAFSYDARDRLASVQLPDGRIVTYTYDPFGRRIKKDFAGVVTYYIYSDEGLIGEYAADGSNQKAYTWQSDSIWGTNPVTLITGGQTYYYHNDHLGTPQKLTDESGNVVWKATYSAFGKAAVDPASTITNNLRFPGQYWDEETGLHWNWYRYYDPSEGRYVSVDPIGFETGDENLYRYVQNSPTYWVDPSGLFAIPIPILPPPVGIKPIPVKPMAPPDPVQWLKDNYNPDNWVEQALDYWLPNNAVPPEAKGSNVCDKGKDGTDKERSPYPPGKRKRFNTKKGAKEAAQQAGKGNEPVKHPDGEHGPHYHPGDGTGKPANHDHYYYPKGR